MRDGRDTLHRFLLEGLGIRGELVHLDATWRSVLARRSYPEPLRSVLGECLGATALLAATIKFDGTLTLQARGRRGPVSLLVVEATGTRTLRGLARFGDLGEASVLPELIGDACLALTVDPGADADRYQGIVEVDEATLSGVIEQYFARSEQLPTKLWLACDGTAVAGLLLQKLPGGDAVAVDDTERAEAWERSIMLADTVTERELLDLDAHTLLRRLFVTEGCRVFQPELWGFACTCSRDRVRTTLQSLGRSECESILEDEGVVDVTCEFCGASYGFDTVDVAELFAPGAVSGPLRTM
jgi:molecular chaperone Hsp33